MDVGVRNVRGMSIDEFSLPLSSMRSEDKEIQKDSLEVSVDGVDGEEEEEFDSDSGMGSDDFDLLEVGGEPGTEFIQVGDQTCSIPLELYDLSDLMEVLSLDVWNECLSEDEKFSLCKYLPAMDQGTFMITMKDLLSGSNIYFGNPVSAFFNMMKGGLCEPSVALRRQGLMFFQKQQYYHFLRDYHNNMVCSFHQIKEVWSHCTGQAVEDKIKLLNDVRMESRLSGENVQNQGMENDSFGKDETPRERVWSQRMMFRNGRHVKGHHSGYDGMMNPKALPTKLTLSIKDQMQDRNDTSRIIYDATSRRNHSIFTRRAMEEIDLSKMKKKKKKKKHDDLNASFGFDGFVDPELALTKNVSDIRVLRSELYRKGKYPEMVMRNSQDDSPTDYNFKDGRNAGRKKERMERGSPVLNMNNFGTSFSPMSDTDRNDDTESDSSDLRGEEAYGYHLKKKLDYGQPVDGYGRFAGARHHKKRKTGSVSPFEVATSSKKSVNLNDKSQLAKVENRASKIKKTKKTNGIDYAGNHLVDCGTAENDNGFVTEFPRLEDEDALLEDRGFVRGRSKKGRDSRTYLYDQQGDFSTPILGCTSVKKKSKGKKGTKKVSKFDHTPSASLHPAELNATDANAMQPSDTHNMEIEMMTVEPEITPQRKTFTIITPTVDCSFMFSVIHLLSAVRIALITPYLEDTLGVQQGPLGAQSMISGEVSNGNHSYENVDGSNSGSLGQVAVPTFSIQEIINRVRLNPGDPCILETPEPLQDLVRGVLKIFSTKLAPLGAKGWKPIAKYERSTKSWSWIGPLTRTSSDQESIEEVTSPEAWGLPHRMLVKLVDAFAIWLKNSQETLREIGSLPPPPASLLQFNIDAKDRLKDLRAQKSLSTISPSTQEVKDYFRKEEFLRYAIPDRAFTYTAADGKKSTVAPLRRGGGKPSAKARDHFMLKSDRPPHVTILCLVRDAAARLPGSIGTRADVCTLIRDSQYIAEDVTDAQVTQILSGALDRLHYEQDPCVKFEQERKLWVYLHRDRDEEDFDEDGTLSTKKWKKPKKDAVDQSTTNVVTDLVEEGQTSQLAVSPQPDLAAGAQFIEHHNPEIIRDPELHVAF